MRILLLIDTDPLDYVGIGGALWWLDDRCGRHGALVLTAMRGLNGLAENLVVHGWEKSES